MLTHVVLYKLKENTAEIRKKMTENFYSMQGKIPALLSVKAGSDILGAERSFDIALVCQFANIDKLKEYQTHPVHLPVKQYVASVVERSHSVDFVTE
ncbi:MAG: Dabb family protein [Clostridiales bacterium]|jgi:hypothetical protein|nr:Dabb family protein [Clostridiales bacterium]